MNMTALHLRLMFIGLLCLPSLCPANPSLTGMEELVGHAYDRQTGEKLYTEHHYQELRLGDIISHKVEYKTPEGLTLAIKNLDYAQSPYAPSFRLEDVRDGYIEGARYTDQGYQLVRRRSSSESLQTEMLPLSGQRDLVADSGFDRYVKAKLASLLTTGSQRFELAVAGRLSSFAFEAKLVDQSEVLGRPAANINVRPASLLRLLTDGIEISYDLETGYLLRYEGISNIRDKNGERYDARIDFPPADRRFTAVDPEQYARQPG